MLPEAGLHASMQCPHMEEWDMHVPCILLASHATSPKLLAPKGHSSVSMGRPQWLWLN